MNPDLPSDEIRRQLRESERDHAEAMPRYRRALSRVLDPSSGATPDDTAQLVGVPARRAFFAGSAVLAAGAVLAACGPSKVKQVPVSGSTPTTLKTTTTTAPGSSKENVTLISTGQSVELLAIQTYQKALDSGIVKTASVIDTIKLFQSQHRDHSGLLSATLRQLGAPDVTQPNQFLQTEVVDKAVSELTDEKSVIDLALVLENTAAATYVKSTGILTTPELRQTVMSIGGVEARHVAVLNGALGNAQVPTPFFRTKDAVPERGYVG